MAYNIISLNNEVLATNFYTDAEAKFFADMRGMYEIRIVDARTGKIAYDYESSKFSGGFVDVGGMSYEDVRRMGHE